MTLISEFHKAEREEAMARTFTRHEFLTYLLITDGVEMSMALAMIEELTAARPDLDMQERLTWEQWLDMGHVDITPPPTKRDGVES